MAGGPVTGGPTSGTPRRSVGSAPRITHFEWKEVQIGPVQVITPAPGEKAEPMTPEKHLAKVLEFDQAKSRGDKRPTLVYFHWPHEDPKHGKLSETLCSLALNDEITARWGKLFRCIQVDMGNSEMDLAKQIGATNKPSFAALDADLKVVTKIAGLKSSTKLCKAIKAAFEKFPDAKKRLKERLKQHKKWLAEAKKLEKAKEYQEAVDLVDKVRFGDVRVGPDYDKALSWGQALSLKAERAAEK